MRASDIVARPVAQQLLPTRRQLQPPGTHPVDPALLKSIGDLTGEQKTTMASIAVTNKGLDRAYLLKEQLRYVFEAKGDRGRQLLTGWLAWAKRSRLTEFTKLAKTIENTSRSS